MKKTTGVILAALFLAALSVPAIAADPFAVAAAPYDRYERGYYPPGGPPPPPRGAPPPPPRHAVYGQPYFFAQGGIFEPNDSSNGLDGYDSGGSFNVGIGSRVSPILAVEGSVGVYGADRGPDEVRVVPLTVGLRLIIPHPFIEPYVGGGVGLYFADLKERRVDPFNDIDDSDTTFGGYASFGVDMWLNPRIALNLEGKYHWAEPTFTAAAGNDIDVKVGGWTANLGIRIAF